MASILVVDDQKAQRKNLAFYLKSQGYDVDTAESGEMALDKLLSTNFDLVISDLKMEEISGLELLKRAKKIRPSTEFIIITGFGSISLAVDSMKEGAADFISKPFEYGAILDSIHKIQEGHQIRVSCGDDSLQMVGQSDNMKEVMDLADRAAASDVSVLIEGEPGTGKELFARIVHSQSRRHRNFLKVIDCAMPEEALEQEIFGSSNRSSGALALANGGTALFRHIELLSPKLQARLLRYLREGTFTPADSAASKRSDVRIIAITTKNLKQKSQMGDFREELYSLLNVMPILIPPLRSRLGDIQLLADHFLAKYRAKNQHAGKEIRGLAPEVISWMTSYDWPGNVQEMENIIARACALSSNEILDESLFFTLPQDRPEVKEDDTYVSLTLKDNQRTLILKALKQNNGNYSRTAAQLGISRTTLWRRMKRFRIEGLPVESL
jgi:DNA-binding NtrC family response regulator